MDVAELGRRVDELARRVLAPLVLGGPLEPVRPVGARIALAIGDRPIPDADLGSRVGVARVRRARRIAPVDTLPDLSAAEWALVAALNDLFQVTNHELAGAMTRGRHVRLLSNVAELCAHVPGPRDVREALARHATLASALEARRTDRLVSWWTGSANFRGQAPSKRLLLWSELRRVRVDETSSALPEMCEGLRTVRAEDFAAVLGLWLTRSPLTDLATLTRAQPLFGWSASTLALVATPGGRTLAWRVLARQPEGQTLAVLGRAAKELPASFGAARALSEEVAREAAQGFRAHRVDR